MIAPTTLLARQHYKSFAERFRGFPMEVRPLSRFVSAKEAAPTREGMAEGTVDIVVGTHALLAKGGAVQATSACWSSTRSSISACSHKERLKELRTDIHVLTLTATPIPRTLQLSLTGVRDLSIIGTPPVDRLAIRTYVSRIRHRHHPRGAAARALPRRAELLCRAAHLPTCPRWRSS